MKEMLFETSEGHRLIGISIQPTDSQIEDILEIQRKMRMGAFDAVFILRTRLNRVTIVNKEDIVRIRPVTVFDTEFDPHLGIGEEL
ncbi:hypothetical protein [Brevibacillus reuszeri]|uniref:hypothetical protein n=1 Tax=Brevibacillus reuszeri TaxID=54915 RepID=UPI003D24BA45